MSAFDVEDALMERLLHGVGVGGVVQPKAVAQGVDAATQAMTPKHGPATAVDGHRPLPFFLAILGWSPVCEL